MKKICEVCGKEYITYDYRTERKYCSRECAAKGRTKCETIEIECDQCGKKVFKKIDKNYLSKKNHFCSLECANKFQGRNKVAFVCKTCGKTFYRSPSWITQRHGYYCSLECRNKDEEWKEKACYNGNVIQNKKKGLNRLELAGNVILDNLGLEYDTQVLINNKICVDVFVPIYNLIIQWDGSYWHGRDKKYEELEPRIQRRVRLDSSQDKYLTECGYTILRFWDSDVYDKEEYVYDTIKTTIQSIA